ncbi:MAG: hypothetical protein ACLFVO_22770 [Chloroflexaceae bacterium]
MEQAARTLLTAAPPPQQADLLAILGVFAAPIMAPTLFINLVTKEKLMSSDLIEYLAKDIIAEQEAKWQTRLETERQTLEARLEAEREARLETERAARLQTERETVASMVSLRFPDAPMRLINVIWRITDVSKLQTLRAAIPDVPDLTTLEQQLRDAAA